MRTNADDEEIPLEAGPCPEEAEEVEDVLESLRRHFAEEARERRRREREYTPLQREHADRVRAYKERLAEQARIYAEAQEADGP